MCVRVIYSVCRARGFLYIYIYVYIFSTRIEEVSYIVEIEFLRYLAIILKTQLIKSHIFELIYPTACMLFNFGTYSAA
jgi:hypothetical protein